MQYVFVWTVKDIVGLIVLGIIALFVLYALTMVFVVDPVVQKFKKWRRK